MKTIKHRDRDPRNNEISNLEVKEEDRPAIESWKPPYSSQAYSMASAIMQRYRQLQDAEAALNDFHTMAREQRRLQDEWFRDVLLICDRTLKHLTGVIENQQAHLTELTNLLPIAPVVLKRD